MSDLHISTEMTGDRGEDTARRAGTYAEAIKFATDDPLIKLRMALGRAYSDIHAGELRPEIVKRLRALLEDPEIAAVAPGYHQKLAEIVRVRSVGERCGDYISKIHHQILGEALVQEASDA